MSPATCDAVTSSHCEAPTRDYGDGTRVLACYRCGGNVCAACSSVQPARILVRRGEEARRATRNVRMCDTCLEHEPDGPARVLLRRYHEAGYPETTIEQTRTWVATERAWVQAHPGDTRPQAPSAPATGAHASRRPAARRP